MLQITIPGNEYWNEKTSEFIAVKETTLNLEHSLVSISKWEAKYCKPFLESNKTEEEVIDYIRFMTITQNVDPKIYYFLSPENVKAIKEYIDAPMTATWFSDTQKKGSGRGEKVTSELIYYWMIASNIPFECQKWHINRLLTLIRVCSIKNEPPKKMSQKEIMSRNSRLNAARRRKMHSKG